MSAAPSQEIRDAAHNAVAAAAIAYHAEADRLAYVFRLAREHGLSDDEIVEASGMPSWFVTRLLGEVG